MGSDRKSKERKKKSRKRSSSSDSEDERRSKKHRSDRKEKGKEKKSHKHRSDKGLQFAEVIMDLKQACYSNDIGTGNQIQHTKQMSQNQSQSLCSEGLSSSDEICAALDKFSNIFKKVMERSNKNMEKLVEILSKKDEMVLQFIVDELIRMGLPFAD